MNSIFCCLTNSTVTVGVKVKPFHRRRPINKTGGTKEGRCTDVLLCPHLQQGADTDRAVRVLIWMLHYSSTESLYGWGLGPGSELLRKVVLKTSGDGGERMQGGISYFTHPLQRTRRHRWSRRKRKGSVLQRAFL